MLGATTDMLPDLLRLLAVPALGWAAWRDVRTRRLPNRLWTPLVAIGLLTLAVDAVGHLPMTTVDDRLFFVRVGVSVLILIPLAYALWWVGGFGGADAKALMTLAILFPTYPVFYLPGDAYPLVASNLGVFSLTILTNAVLVGLAYPLYLGVRNALRGDISPIMFVGRRTAVAALPTEHGRLFETTEGFTRHGLDVDALRMYLRWRGTSLAALRGDPETYRDPESVGETHDPTDGAVGAAAVDAGGDADDPDTVPDFDGDYDDPWAAERFLDDIEGNAYGTTPEGLREGLRVVTTRETVWLSPGVPFIVPVFLGLVIALIYGDLLFGLLRAVGAV
ncbi:A24 family peptidase [Haloplanus aerogenes]|uniref:A24 family peptidase n=1 Tax=Haloplanus aerogenes TaxID=660522 RepID=A0A3M0D1F9_9EURY|nr:A24 family peptidase [Haloplanus aerogenes]AZH23901.1 A24 family peptidase [Haloplanus aerogenes]RMB13339.1 preflagellin peptidase FlaK [Haloplanus aerogenes]